MKKFLLAWRVFVLSIATVVLGLSIASCGGSSTPAAVEAPHAEHPSGDAAEHPTDNSSEHPQ